ncbi:MAG: cobalamin-dependent protein [Bacteroidetes bacterium]|jgi:MerR family transcriptional regulator, light-induced transcriptional regulator|nr:cobalamin-dependent protein [Bacteroidota bacterium]
MIADDVFKSYFDSLISGKRNDCRIIVDGLMTDHYSVEEIYSDLFQRSLYQVGEYWERNLISVATEHMATAITENLMILLQPAIFTTERVGKKAVIATVAGEYHQVGAKMVADIFEMNGWDGFFLGGNTPGNELIRFIDENKPDVIGLSLTIYFNFPVLISGIKQIRHYFDDTPLIVGGQAFRWGVKPEALSAFKETYYLDSIGALNRFF